MIYVGIDPGLKGGVALHCGNHVEAFPIPVVDGYVDVATLADEFRKYDDMLAIVEKVGAMPGQGVVSMFNFGRCYGTLIGLCIALGIKVELVTPQKWKGEVLAGTTKDKEAAIAYCRRVYPEVKLIQPRCRVPHDGMADALCLAEYGRRTY